MGPFIEIISAPDNIAIVVMILMVIFFTVWAFLQAFRNDARRRKGERIEGEGDGKTDSWKPLVRIEFVIALIVFIGLTFWSLVVDAPLEELASPTLTPNPAKAPWYFLGLQEMLVYFDPWIAGVVLPTLIIIGLIAIPYIDNNPKGNGYYTFAERKWAILIFCFGFLALWILLIVIGVFFRGPGWLWFWPWEAWDHHRVIYEGTTDLTNLVGIDSRSGLGFFIGGGLVTFYYVLGIVLPYLYWKKRNPEFLEDLGVFPYVTISFLFWTMLALPIKMFLRLVLLVKYVWVTPWFNI